MIDSIIGNYKIIEKIGEGGMGAVYRGIDMMLEREVAIKALRPEFGSQPAVVERFRSEAVTLAKLNHPNIATLYNFFRHGDHFFMVLEFVRGATLDSVINMRGAMPFEQAIMMFSQVLEGIEHAHRYGVVHRDIKPGNVMLTHSGTLKVLDFGIARVLGTSRMTKAGHLIGTIEYMSPEQVRGQETDARSDIYSLGVLFYEMLTGRVPFSADSEFELMKSQIETLPQPPREFAPHIPNAVEAAILKALAKKPEDRFQTAGEFRLALSGIAASATSSLDSFPNAQSYQTTPLSNSSVNSLNTSPISHPPVSQPLSNPDFSQEVAKETRIASGAENFGALSIPSASTPQAKETRIGVAADAAQLSYAADSAQNYSPQMAMQEAASTSLLSKLNWKHYAVAGTVAALLLIILTVSVALMTGGAKQEPPVASSPVVTQSVPEPTAQPTQEPSSAVPDTAETAVETPAADSTAPSADTTPARADTTTHGATQTANDFSAPKPGVVAKSSTTSPAKQPNKTVMPKPLQSASTAPPRDDGAARRRAETLKAMDQ